MFEDMIPSLVRPAMSVGGKGKHGKTRQVACFARTGHQKHANRAP